MEHDSSSNVVVLPPPKCSKSRREIMDTIRDVLSQRFFDSVVVGSDVRAVYKALFE